MTSLAISTSRWANVNKSLELFNEEDKTLTKITKLISNIIRLIVAISSDISNNVLMLLGFRLCVIDLKEDSSESKRKTNIVEKAKNIWTNHKTLLSVTGLGLLTASVWYLSLPVPSLLKNIELKKTDDLVLLKTDLPKDPILETNSDKCLWENITNFTKNTFFINSTFGSQNRESHDSDPSPNTSNKPVSSINPLEFKNWTNLTIEENSSNSSLVVDEKNIQPELNDELAQNIKLFKDECINEEKASECQTVFKKGYTALTSKFKYEGITKDMKFNEEELVLAHEKFCVTPYQDPSEEYCLENYTIHSNYTPDLALFLRNLYWHHKPTIDKEKAILEEYHHNHSLDSYRNSLKIDNKP